MILTEKDFELKYDALLKVVGDNLKHIEDKLKHQVFLFLLLIQQML